MIPKQVHVAALILKIKKSLIIIIVVKQVIEDKLPRLLMLALLLIQGAIQYHALIVISIKIEEQGAMFLSIIITLR